MSVHLSECLPWREGRGKPLQGEKLGVPSPDMVYGHLQPGQFPESEGKAGLFQRERQKEGKEKEGFRGFGAGFDIVSEKD